MSQVTLSSTTGRAHGSPESRRLRREDHIPAVVYGGGGEPVSITVERADLRRALTTPAGRNALVDLRVDGASQVVVVKDIQRHPVRRTVLHVDFLRVRADEKVTVEVPIVLTGAPEGTTQSLEALTVTGTPGNLPSSLSLDASGIGAGTLTVAALRLPAGVATDVEADTVIATGPEDAE